METISGASVIERGIFDPRHSNEAAVFAAWACSVTIIYWKLAAKHQSGTQFKLCHNMLSSPASAEAPVWNLPTSTQPTVMPYSFVSATAATGSTAPTVTVLY